MSHCKRPKPVYSSDWHKTREKSRVQGVNGFGFASTVDEKLSLRAAITFNSHLKTLPSMFHFEGSGGCIKGASSSAGHAYYK